MIFRSLLVVEDMKKREFQPTSIRKGSLYRFEGENMKKIEIDIQLNPVSDGARWIPEKVRKKVENHYCCHISQHII